MPVRPAAYGKPLGEAYYAIPYKDGFGELITVSETLEGS